MELLGGGRGVPPSDPAVPMGSPPSRKTRDNRRLLLAISVTLGVFQCITLAAAPLWPLKVFQAALMLCLQLAMIVACVCYSQLPLGVLRAYIIGLAVVIFLFDLNARSVGRQPIWSGFVLVTDLALVVRVGGRFAAGLTAAASLWLVVAGVEHILRFGVFDLPGAPSARIRWDYLADSVSCAHPPCPDGVFDALFDLQGSLIVLLIDFAATWDFANSAEKEKAAMAQTIDTVGAIAHLLAGYDVDTVAVMLREAEAGCVPPAIHEALHRLEQNLRAYRPYLPRSCIPSQYHDDAHLLLSESGSRSRMSLSRNEGPLGSSRVSVEMHSAPLLGALKSMRATMMVVNVGNTLMSLGQGPDEFASFFEALLNATVSAVEARCGLVDVFVGDRVLASFNTSRPCTVHASAAAGASQQILRLMHGSSDNSLESALRVNIGAAAGRVLCGDTGCAEMRRFSLLGALPVIACGMERAARALGLEVICNTVLRQDTEYENVLRLVPRLIRLVKATASGGDSVRCALQDSEGGCRVYELMQSRADEVSTEEMEWMYHIGKGATEWEPYNAAMRAYLGGLDLLPAAELAGDYRAEAEAALRALGSKTTLSIHV